MFPLPFNSLCHNSQQMLRQKTVLRYSWSRISARFKGKVKLCLDKKLHFGFQNNFSFYMCVRLLLKYKLTLKRTETKIKCRDWWCNVYAEKYVCTVWYPQLLLEVVMSFIGFRTGSNKKKVVVYSKDLKKMLFMNTSFKLVS